MFNRITVDPKICGGKPCIKGTRIPVVMILDLLEDGLTFDQILQDYYPHITAEDIRACIKYARALVEGEEIYLAGELEAVAV